MPTSLTFGRAGHLDARYAGAPALVAVAIIDAARKLSKDT